MNVLYRSNNLLKTGQTFAYEGFYKLQRNDGISKTITVEEMAVITADGAEYMVAPQEKVDFDTG